MGATRQHQGPPLGLLNQLKDQPCLADTGLALNEDD
jgi:hypothetical protein